jgi:2-aminoadipate transaminase
MEYSKRILATPSSFIRNILKVTDSPNVISFAGGLPNPISFPVDKLRESVNRAIDTDGTKLFQYSTTTGYAPLRQYIADKYNNNFDLGITPDDIIITTGSQQALSLLGQVLVNEGDGIIIEEPGYLGAIQAFMLSQPVFYPVTLEQDGLNIDELKAAVEKPNAKFIYTVPNFQNPTGLTYTQEKRDAVYDVLKNYPDIVLIEDDPYGELRFEGESLPYIGGKRLPNSVILGSFSKTVAPGMRIGFIISKNKELMTHVETAKQAADLHTNIFSQYVLYDYLTNNEYQEHVSKIIDLYGSQATAMLEALDKYMPKNIQWTKPEGGMFIWLTLPEGQSALELFDKAMAADVAFVPGDPFYTGEGNVPTLRLNYTASTPEVIDEGIKRLASIFKEA